jgi:hypothetical protein
MLSDTMIFKKTITVFFLLCLGCNTISVDQPSDHTLNSNKISIMLFGDAVNKMSASYVGFKAVRNYKKTGNDVIAADSIYYTGDTLVLEILSIDSTRAIIKEYVSSNHSPNTGHQCTYSLTLRNDSLIPGGGFDSSILTFPRFFSQYLPPSTDLPLISMETMFHYLHVSSNFAQVQSVSVNGETYPMLHGFFNLKELAVDGAGFYVLYHNSTGIVRIFTYGLMFPSGTGWDLIKS